MDFWTVFLVLIVMFLCFFVGYFIARFKAEHEWRGKIPEIRNDAVVKSRAVLAGQFSEQLAPFLPDFPFSPSEARFVGKPVDFIVFKGLDSKEPEEIVFVEVKSGKSKLSGVEKKLKDIIDKKKVSWYEYRISKELTEKKD